MSNFLERALPWGSFSIEPWGIQLNRELSDLGFASLPSFATYCASYGRTGSSIQSDGAREVSFDNHTNTLYVFKGISNCIRKGHRLEAATGIMATLDGMPALINVNYCPQCRKYFIGYSEYVHYRNYFGPLLARVRFDGFSKGGGFDSLAEESPLMLCGYNVKAKDGPSSHERHLILAAIIDCGILSKPEVINYLNSFVSRSRNNPNMRLAVSKWEGDLDWVRHYRMDKQRHFIIDRVRSNR